MPQAVSANYRPRWATLAKSALGAAAALGTLTASQAKAFVVTVDSVQYDVITFSVSYNSNIGKFALPANGGCDALVEKFNTSPKHCHRLRDIACHTE